MFLHGHMDRTSERWIVLKHNVHVSDIGNGIAKAGPERDDDTTEMERLIRGRTREEVLERILLRVDFAQQR